MRYLEDRDLQNFKMIRYIRRLEFEVQVEEGMPAVRDRVMQD